MEEVVRAFNHVIETGKAFYWGKRSIMDDIYTSTDCILNLIAPITEQVQYHCLHRQRFESEYKYLFEKYNYGTTIWSALAGGLLTGKYNDGIPKGSRFDTNSEFFKNTVESLSKEDGQKKIEKVKELTAFAEKELGCSVANLALAWAASHPHVWSLFLPCSSVTDEYF
ncbi:Putative voltage-gated potassium channel subunit beta AltName: Full=K(+) channel subunit beta [Rhizoctonia solani AG-1 IB]|uniref:Rhizoctonia solani AG1-IB WGS project CAOJ00000000 data, isolate 7/3/14, contig 04931 n=1 Tax=Thanatephorus cucumeris (strain AG1-IB / isolate 7/3/14) TaxID=1108050 RepID=M5BLU4_THACB|nr:Putative voltage-gated potassium channel subunit beta AltName: Full=K(+) channel subunit beta [Rhizoctonia solani AG-1 IB]